MIPIGNSKGQVINLPLWTWRLSGLSPAPCEASLLLHYLGFCAKSRILLVDTTDEEVELVLVSWFVSIGNFFDEKLPIDSSAV